MLCAGPMCLIGSKLNGHAKSEILRPLRDTVGIQYISLRFNDSTCCFYSICTNLVVNFEPAFLKDRNLGLLDHLAIYAFMSLSALEPID